MTDINMPRMDGIEASTRILAEQKLLRETKSNIPEVMIVAFTAFDNADTLKKCSEAGINHCLSKPIKPEQLEYILEFCKSQSPDAKLALEKLKRPSY